MSDDVNGGLSSNVGGGEEDGVGEEEEEEEEEGEEEGEGSGGKGGEGYHSDLWLLGVQRRIMSPKTQVLENSTSLFTMATMCALHVITQSHICPYIFWVVSSRFSRDCVLFLVCVFWNLACTGVWVCVHICKFPSIRKLVRLHKTRFLLVYVA